MVRFECPLSGPVDEFVSFLKDAAVPNTFGSGSSRGMGVCRFELVPKEGLEHV